MNVDAVTSATTSSSALAKTSVDYESFLKLLVTQMKNQDPTKPMESTDYIAQLATFSQVEQTIQSNTKLDSLLQQSLLAQASGIIGRTVTSPDGGTSGVVKETLISDGAVTAILESGKQIRLGSGMMIR